MTCPFVFLVVLPDQMVLIPVDSHFSWLTMFYIKATTAIVTTTRINIAIVIV